MSSSLASRLKHPKRHELTKSHSQAQLLANRLRQDGVMSTVEDVLQALEQIAALFNSNIPDNMLSYKDSVINLCQHLKVYGAYLEILYKDRLDHAFNIFRDKAQADPLEEIRLYLLEMIELRAKGWKGTDEMNLYYKKKLNQCGTSQVDMSESISSLSESVNSLIATTSPPMLGPGEVVKTSGKFSKPTRIPGKKYCKDEVVIRNADSGKVMGIKGRRVHMIEELSETIISFQRVNPGAKERLVQITGATEESINHAKQLIEDTIRRNASPVRDPMMSASGGPLTGSSSSINSSASDDSALPPSARASRAMLMHSLSTNDAHLGEYKYTVTTNGCTIRIIGDNLEVVRTSKLVLDEYFSGEPIHDVTQFYSFDSLPQPILPEEFPTPGPLSPPESLPSPEIIPNGEKVAEEDYSVKRNLFPRKKSEPRFATESLEKSILRKPRLSIEEILREQVSREKDSPTKSNMVYSIDFLAHLAMSPLCLAHPNDWEKIVQEYPNLIRTVVDHFDAKQYLSTRTTEPSGLLSADDVDPNEI